MEKMPHSLPIRMVAGSVAAGFVLLAGSLGATQRQGRPADQDAATINHVLNRITFGVRPGDVARVQARGIQAYIDDQLHPERLDDGAVDARLAAFTTLTMSSGDLAKQYFVPAEQARRSVDAQQARAARQGTMEPQMTDSAEGSMPPVGGSARQGALQALPADAQRAIAAQRVVMMELTQAKMLRAVESERQLQEVLTDFWFNHFNVFVGKGVVREYLTEYERDAIRPHVLGRFRDLLGAVAHSPAMLFYLDNWQSSTPEPVALPDARRQRLGSAPLTPDQRRRLMDRLAQAPPAQARPSRGLNENYARELMELHTLGVDAGYTQADVVALARILTGWTIDRPRQGGTFIFRPGMHDSGSKTLLGKPFLANGQAEGEMALDLLAQHPATARHIATKLAQRFVADDPPPALVDRAARTFLDSRGDLRAVVRLILTSPEFYAAEARRAKVKTPLEFVASAVRATNATVMNAQPLVAAMSNLGMPLYGSQPPTGYSMTADAWVNTGALLNRMNLAVQLVSGGRVQVDQPGRGGAGQARPDAQGAGRGRGLARPGASGRAPIQIDIAALAPDTTPASVASVVNVLLAGDASEATRQTLARATTPQQLVALALGAPEFQRR